MSPAETLKPGLSVNLFRLRSHANLPQEGGKIEVNPSRRNLFGCEVVFVEGAAKNLNLLARCLDIRKGAPMLRVKTPFHGNQIFRVGQVPNGMYIPRKPCDERTHKVISQGGLPFECSRRKVDYDIIRIVGENSVFIGAFPGIELLLNKRADVFWRHLDSCNLHSCSLLDAAITSPLGGEYIPVAGTSVTAAPKSLAQLVGALPEK